MRGIAAGLHATVQFPAGDSEEAIVAEARRHGIEVTPMSEYGAAKEDEPTLLLGYAPMPEPTIRAGVRQLGRAVRASRG